MSSRQYSKSVEAALFALSVNCYYPNCQIPTVSINPDRTQHKNVQIAHIVAISPGGPRYRPLPDDEVNGFDNLILLCNSHHPRVDKKSNEHLYPEDLLRTWKQEAEKDLRAKVDGLSNLTKDQLEEMLSRAATSMREEILSAIDSLREVSEDSADLLTELFEHVKQHYIDQETAAMLYTASLRLSDLSDNALILLQASQQLSYLEEGSVALQTAAQKLEHLEGNSGTLAKAAENLQNLELGLIAARLTQVGEQLASDQLLATSQRLEQFCHDYASMLRQTPDLPDLRSEVEAAAEPLLSELDTRLRELRSNGMVEVVDHPQRWRFATGGFVAGVLAALAIAILSSTGVIG